MTKIIISGCSGHMGHVLTQLIEADPETTAVAGIPFLPRRQNARFPPMSLSTFLIFGLSMPFWTMP